MEPKNNLLNRIPCSAFNEGSCNEFFFAFEAPFNFNFVDSLNFLFSQYDELLNSNGLGPETEMFLRFHVSDITNQSEILHTWLRKRNPVAKVYIVGQPPATGSKIAVEAYHIKASQSVQKALLSDGLIVTHGAYQTLWLQHTPTFPGTSAAQTNENFKNLLSTLECHNLSLERDVIRTWIYVRDVDNNYQGMVDVRRELFEKYGMTRDTHYIASTGIEGHGENVKDLVIMDTLAVKGLDRRQITYMSAPDYLNPTYEYNVTFERATRVIYGDRAHYYISGTASIDNEGNILHIGNIERQANRTLVNVEALLNRYDAGLKDLKILVVYIRDIADYTVVQSFLQTNLPGGIPYIIVKGSVCRPQWLIEMEGVAVTSEFEPDFKPFC